MGTLINRFFPYSGSKKAVILSVVAPMNELSRHRENK
jgi:hypothetical protein